MDGRKKERQGWERKIESETRVRERKIGRETGWEIEIQGRYREREIQREREEETGEKERDIGRETGLERERDTGEKEKNYKHKKIHGILSCRASLPGTKWSMTVDCSTTSVVLQSTVVFQSSYHKILTIQSLYRYTAVIELTKIFKFGHPKSLLETFELSSQNNWNLIIVSAHKNSQFHD